MQSYIISHCKIARVAGRADRRPGRRRLYYIRRLLCDVTILCMLCIIYVILILTNVMLNSAHINSSIILIYVILNSAHINYVIYSSINICYSILGAGRDGEVAGRHALLLPPG